MKIISILNINQRTNVPEIYLLYIHVPINMFEYRHSAGADAALRAFFFFKILKIINILSIY